MPPLNNTAAATGGHAHLAVERSDEFPSGASVWPEGMNRRQFLELMAASFALAGLGACNRPPDKTIVPYVVPPERQFQDAALYYATAMPWEGYGRGLLALSHSGRPTKLEGNPAHPDSLGATDILMQAAVLSLYDPDRSRTPRRGAVPASWTQFEDEWLAIHRELLAKGGEGFAVLTEPTTSPTELRGVHQLLERFPKARWYQHTALPRYDRDGEQPEYDFGRADIVVSLESDFLIQHPSGLRYARAFADRRRIEGGKVRANRLYVIEAAPTLTGSMADHRLPASPSRQPLLLQALVAALDGRALPSGLSPTELRVIPALASDLRQHAPNVLFVAGEQADAVLHSFAGAMNTRLGADGVTHFSLPPVRSDANPRSAGDLATFVEQANRGRISTVAILGCNPAYTGPADLRFPDAVKKVARRIHLGSHVDETAVLCHWHAPESHFLEAWSDIRAYDGTASIVQPLIAPMYHTRSSAELLFFLADPPGRSGYDLVRETWRRDRPEDAAFERRWQEWLSRGVVEDTAGNKTKPRPRGELPRLDVTPAGERLHVLFRPDPNVRDGRWANNAWLQELPKPLTQLVWDNPVQVSPAYAAAHHLAVGDVLRLRFADGEVTAPVWIAPGLAAECAVLHLGYGRTQAGSVGNGIGVDAFRVRDSRSPWARSAIAAESTGDRALPVSTQTHFSMEGRDLARTAPAKNPSLGRKPEEPPSLFPDWNYPSYRWGMLIDLGTCIGCKACVIACQAENNSPVVGRDQVSRGREMHWLRVDQYYEGDPDNPEVHHQPVPCMQCEKAPCELVCPVAATVHSSEGLNDMVYNRCVGTRYCSNNCPYKVRRFNFLDYREPKGSTVYLQKNPDVTVRERGVMEKCTYCVQRINAARITAERENRRVRDGEVRTACQQACPTDAIVFGDLNDPSARVRARKTEPTHYVLLEELNTRPRTTYLAKITNKNDQAEGAS